MLQAVVVDSVVQNFLSDIEGLEVQLEKSVAPVDESLQTDMASLKATISMLEGEGCQAEVTDSLRTVLKGKKEAADTQFKQDMEEKMSRAYEDLGAALYKGIKDKDPYAAAKWSAAVGAAGGHATPHA
jgi:phage shock protein A